MNWLKAHWVRGVPVVCFLLGGLLGYTARPQSEVHESDAAEFKSVKQEWSARTFQRVTDTKLVRVTDRTFRPDGTLAAEHVDERAAEHVDERAAATGGVRTDSAGTRITKRDVTPVLPNWRVALLAGASLRLSPLEAAPTFGLAAERRIAGPFAVGAWALYTPSSVGLTAGLSLSISF